MPLLSSLSSPCASFSIYACLACGMIPQNQGMLLHLAQCSLEIPHRHRGVKWNFTNLLVTSVIFTKYFCCPVLCILTAAMRDKSYCSGLPCDKEMMALHVLSAPVWHSHSRATGVWGISACLFDCKVSQYECI